MTDTELYTQILGLTPPWQVCDVTLDPEARSVRVRVEPTADAQWRCPECQQPAPGYDEREERTWRHLDSCAFTTWLVARVPRVQCPTHGVKTVAAPWAEPHSRFTQAFACFAQRVLQATRVQSHAASLLRLTPAEVHDLLDRVVRDGLAAATEERPAPSGPRTPAAPSRHLTLDEKQYGPGQSYLTVLGDPAAGRVVAVADTRTQEATVALLTRALPPSERAAVRTVSLDLWAPFLAAVAQVLPAADRVYDRFHAAQELNDAVDATRRVEHRRLRTDRPSEEGRPPGSSPLTGTRFWWLHHVEDLSAEQRTQLEALRAAGLQTAQVWACKEAFRAFFDQPDEAAGAAFFEQWSAQAVAVGSEPLTAVAEKFARHRELLLAYLRHHRTNAFAEYLNGAIQQIKTAARGFRNFTCYRRSILFFLGKLGRCPQTFS
jgi:transposase